MQSQLTRLHQKFTESISKTAKAKEKPKLYQRLYEVLKEAILNNEIPELSSLPPTRQLAELLELSRSTVIKAYELLRLEGYIDSKSGSGHTVKPIRKTVVNLTIDPEKTHLYPEVSDVGKSFLKNVNLINTTNDKSIAFRPGLPPLDIFPVGQWKRLSNLYWRYVKFSDLSYSPSSGLDYLKKNLANYLNLSRGIKCDYRQIVIVSGSVQSLYLLGTALLNPGDGVVLENPTFPNVNSIFKGLRASITALPLDKEGLDIQALKHSTEHVKLIHTTPSCHYPFGQSMSENRKRELIKWADEHHALIIENDYEHQIHNYYENKASIFSLDPHQRTVYLGTFNRILHPSIRLGYMVLPPYLIEPMDALLKHSHRFVPPSIQIVLNQFIEKNYLHNHIDEIISVSESRKAIFKNLFEKEFGGEIKLTQSQVPSLHLVAEFPSSVDDNELVANFSRKNIITHALSKCYLGNPERNGLIMGYSSVIEPHLKRKLTKMSTAYREYVQHHY